MENKKLTAQLGSNANIVGERPLYMPRTPSFWIICSKLPIMRLPGYIDSLSKLHVM